MSVRCLNADTTGVLMQQARHVTSVQAHPILDEAPEPATSLQQTRVPDGDLQRSAPSSPALQHHDNSGVAAIHTLSSMQQEAQQPAPSSNADRPVPPQPKICQQWQPCHNHLSSMQRSMRCPVKQSHSWMACTPRQITCCPST